MLVILLDKVNKLGGLGDKVEVKAGFARNYLFPQQKAVPATKQHIERFEARRAEIEADQAKTLAAAKARAEKIVTLGSITISSKAGEEGKLFGSVGNRDIATALSAAGVEVSKSDVRLPHGALRATGEHEVNIHIHTEVSAKLTVNIVAE